MKTRLILGMVMAMVGLGPAQAQVSRDYKVVAAGQRVRVDTLTSLDPNCKSRGTTEVNLLTAPRGGQVETTIGREYASYVAANVRSVCDKQRVPATMIYYRASPDFSGPDSFDAEILFPGGTARRIHYTVQVR